MVGTKITKVEVGMAEINGVAAGAMIGTTKVMVAMTEDIMEEEINGIMVAAHKVEAGAVAWVEEEAEEVIIVDLHKVEIKDGTTMAPHQVEEEEDTIVDLLQWEDMIKVK